MEKEIDLEQFMKILNNALNSDNPAVKKALSNFLLIAALCEESTDKTGLFDKLLHRLDYLEKKIAELHKTVANMSYPNLNRRIGTGTGFGSGIGMDESVYKKMWRDSSNIVDNNENTFLKDLYKLWDNKS